MDVNFRKCSLHSECVKKDTYPETSHPNTERNIKPHLKDSCSTRPCLIFLFSPHRSDVGVKSFDLGGKIWSRHVNKYSENRVADHRNRKAQGCTCTHWEGREERALFKTAQFFIFVMLACICSHLYQNLMFFLRAKNLRDLLTTWEFPLKSPDMSAATATASRSGLRSFLFLGIRRSVLQCVRSSGRKTGVERFPHIKRPFHREVCRG